MISKEAVVIKPGKLFIDGKWVNSVSGKTFDTLNPAREEVITSIAEGDRADIDLAVAAARKAFEEGPWKKMDARDRGKILLRIMELIDKNKDELALLETLDNGKPISETTNADIPLAIDCFLYYAGWADKIHGETIPVRGEFFNYTLREPVGVVGQIIPWNFPLLMAAWKIAPALACGNTIVLKPAEETPLTALRLGEICQEAGLPDGVLNIVPGYGPTAGAALAEHMDVDKIAFTGAHTTGRIIMQAASKNLKRITLELGGKSPNIVFADSDIESAVDGAMTGIFFNQGEVCCAGSRLFLERSIHDEFVDKLSNKAANMRVGNPEDAGTQMGAQVSKEQLDKILGYIDVGKQEGAKLVTGGERCGEKGYFIRPTIFDAVDNNMKIAREEIFGPVVSAITFDDVDEVVRQGNLSVYGLAAAVWTKDIKKAHRLARDLKAGTIWINTYNALDAASPFGGFKQSGFGRELGVHALELYTQIKSVWINLGS
ncbi:MAG: aldehyde dehydrogenase family protein [Candidatus Scalindua sp.]|jgi:aldehyde dehydrogenase (NAD+)|nr:aldehyde dehydrogenase family protein [Candidatus Scalindua sp.]MBT5303955.1 aldehyde dehydrogenase family protein [Candidatus Scalindua sp.]MBT6230047.1 aldehyde dehydrogenase family protein [Candidatus Scalindua sp.]MBT6564310.1 aldehyde dehydrogenase family protein [Candidatus Scalindua sp.]MBT7212704.1 aldehyde dehydrogenase family protein [Candidatus Scalindua sp.]